jgi:hypothetical protein
MINTELREYSYTSKGIAWDTCHKIYVLMDSKQVEIMRGYGYGNENDPDSLITSDQMNPTELYEKVESWYENSCGLRFIQAVSTGEQGEPVFYDIVAQFEGEYAL